MWPFTKKITVSPPPTLEDALTRLNQLGVDLASGFTIDDVRPSLTGPFNATQLLCVLGNEAEGGDGELLSRDIWHLDAECIEDHGDYARLAHRFSVLAGDALPLSNVSDHVDIEANMAWLEFDCGGRRHHWDLAIDNDWIDPVLYTNFQKLLRARSKSRFMICALGQDSLVLCGDQAKRDAISAFSGLRFEWE